MAVTMIEDLHNQFERAIAMVRFTTEEFEEDEWTSGISWFYTPARLALHTCLALEGYFFYRPGGECESSFSLTEPWWKLADEHLPGQESLLASLTALEERIDNVFDTLSDEDLAQPFSLVDYSGKTLAGHYAYALRHTMHHQGALSVLATRHGHEGECWR